LNESRVSIVQYLERDISYSVEMYHTVAAQYLKEWIVMEYLQNSITVRERKEQKKEIP